MRMLNAVAIKDLGIDVDLRPEEKKWIKWEDNEEKSGPYRKCF